MPRHPDRTVSPLFAVSSSKQLMKQSHQEESVIRTDEVADSAPAKHHRARTTRWRGWAACLASVAATLGMAFVPSLGATSAGAAGGAVTTITGHAGSTAPSLGVPAPAASAQISPTYVARAANGDLAVAQTKAGSVFVYLIPAADEANVYNIQTAPSPSPAFGALTAGDAYIVAGTGTAGLIAEPGNNQFNNSTTAVATANPIVPTSVTLTPPATSSSPERTRALRPFRSWPRRPAPSTASR